MNANYENYLIANKKSANTIKSYLRIVEKFLAFCGKEDEDIDYKDVFSYQLSLSKLSANTVNQSMFAIKNYCAFLTKFKILEENPCEDFKPLRVNPKKKAYVTEEDIKAMLDATTNYRDKAIIKFLISTGLRISELCDITIDEYNKCVSDGTFMIVVNGKGNKSREIYLNSSVVEAVNLYLKFREDNNCDKLFASFSKRGTKLNEDSFNRTLKRYARDAHLPYAEDISCHWLRAGFASIAAEKGVPIHVLMTALGHSAITTTQIYTKTNQKQVNKAMNMMSF